MAFPLLMVLINVVLPTPRNQLHRKQLSLPRPKKQRQIREVILSLLMKWIETRPHPRLGLMHQVLFLWTQSLANRSSKKVTQAIHVRKIYLLETPLTKIRFQKLHMGLVTD